MKTKTFLLLSLTLIGWATSHAQSASPEFPENGTAPQSSENIIMERTVNGKTTTIELKNGQMYVDGKKVEGENFGQNLKTMRKLGRGMNLKTIPEAEIEIDLPNAAPGNNKAKAQEQDSPNNDRPMLGVTTKETEDKTGAEVVNVAAGSAAEKAGLMAGDVITSLGNITIKNPEDLADAVSKFTTDDNVEIKYMRGSKARTAVAELGTHAQANPFGNNPFGNNNPFADMFGNGQNPLEGFMKMFGDDEMNSFGTNKKIRNADNPKIGLVAEERADNDGVRISEITTDGIAQKGGLKVDDVITTFGDKQIKSIDDLSEAITDAKKQKDIVVNIKRGREVKTLYLQLPVQLRNQYF